MIDVALTRSELRPADVAIVVDVLRATSTATTALAAGYRRVLCAETIERALELRAPGRVLAGERRCLKPPGFDQGNSPADAATLRGEELVLATTNGTPAIFAAALHASHVLLGCLLNLDAVLAAIELRRAERPDLDVQIVCSGTDGAVALEDVYVAGRMSAALRGPRTDAALVAAGVARAYATAVDALAAGADARVLQEAGLTADIAECARESQLRIVPFLAAAHDGVAVIVAGEDALDLPTVPAARGDTVLSEPGER